MADDKYDNFSDDLGFSDEGHSSETSSFHGQGGALTIGNKQYAWGLLWDIPHLNSEDEKLSKRKIAKEACIQAKNNNANLYLVTSTQYALGSSEYGHAKGMKTVATSLMDRWGDNFLACFEIEGYYYLVAVKDGIILPGSDIRVEDEAEARSYINSKLSDDDSEEWSRIIAPAAFGFDHSSEEDLITIVSSSRSKARLKDATSKSLIKQIAVISIIGLVGYGAYWGYNVYTEHKAQVEEQARKMRSANLALEAKRRAQEMAKNESWPWDEQPIGQYALLECQSAMSHTSIVLPGYDFAQMQCIPKTGEVTVLFKQTTGNYATVADLINLTTTMKPHLQHNGKEISVIYDYSPLFSKYMYTKHGIYGNVTDESIWLDETTNLDEVNSFFDISVVTPPKTDPNKNKNNNKNKIKGSNQNVDHIVFETLNIKIARSEFEPLNWIKYVNPIKSFVVHSVTVSSGKSKNDTVGYLWSIDASAYEPIWQSNIDNPKLPHKDIPLRGSKNETRVIRGSTKPLVGDANTHKPSTYVSHNLVGGKDVEYKTLSPHGAPRRSMINVAPVPFNPNQNGPVLEKQ